MASLGRGAAVVCGALVLLCACSGGGVAGRPRTIGKGVGTGADRSDPTDWPGLDARIRRRLRVDHLDGAVLVVRHGDADVVRRSYGRYSAHTTLPLASASKWLTAATVMSLVDEGKLTLDAPISSYATSIQGAAGRVTLRQLLSHTHGLEDAPACLLDPSQPSGACDAEVSSLRSFATPGTRFRYGPTGPTLAARVVEIAGGQPFEYAFQTRIGRPLGMDRTSFVGSVPGRPAPARTVPDPAAGVVSTADDYVRFVQMLADSGTYGGHQVLTWGSVATMLTLATAGARFKDDQVAAELPSVGYALGAWVEEAGPDGATVFIDGSGAYGAYPWIDRRRGVYGMLLVYDGADPGATGAVARSHADVVAVGHVLDHVLPRR